MAKGNPNNARSIELGGKHYRIVQRLGGMRERFKVFDPHAAPGGGHRVIQVLERTRSTSQYLRVLQRKSDHNSNIPTILGCHFKRDKIYLLLPWIEGPTLKAYLGHRKRWPNAFESFRLVRSLAHGLRHVSSHRCVVHGDITPANLIVRREPTALILIDYGNAWTVEQAVSRTPGDGTDDVYAAPEHLGDGEFKPDYRSDLFSVSVIFYQMITGKIPYGEIGGRAGLDILRPVYEPKYIAPSHASLFRRDLSRKAWRQIDQIITRGLALSPADRYDSYHEWIQDFDEARRTIDKLGKELSGISSLVYKGYLFLRKNLRRCAR